MRTTDETTGATAEGEGSRSATWRNWSGHLRCTPAHWLRPRSEQELRDAVRGATSLRVAGSGHSFTPLVPTDQTLLSLERLSGIVSVDRERRRAEVWAGTTIAALGPLLAAEGLALANQGDIDRQAIAGAVATGTHGTGLQLGCIASRVVGCTLVTAGGELLRVCEDENAELLRAAPVSLGALGVISRLELACEPRYNLRERTWVEETDALLRRFDEHAAAHRHFELFAFPFTGLALAKSLDREPFAPLPEGEPESPGSGFARLLELNRQDPQAARRVFAEKFAQTPPSEGFGPSFRVFPSERTDLFNEMEYAVPLDGAVDVVREVLAAIERADLPVLFPIELRTVAADPLWLSPFHGEEGERFATVAVHQDAGLDFEPVFAVCEPILRAAAGRPHWGKIHTLEPAGLAPLYPRWDDFRALRARLDPRGKLLSAPLRRLFGESVAASAEAAS
ncbi:MAG: FAD-binding protein [Acidobacteria bacterium]|nr:MAG: FAD-binding protein [Acidobacteriota bacterium]REK03763.1 MAG: FAD-binding protein [Acidobacteriota bacterium]